LSERTRRKRTQEEDDGWKKYMGVARQGKSSDVSRTRGKLFKNVCKARGGQQSVIPFALRDAVDGSCGRTWIIYALNVGARSLTLPG
jgi:hypothetical protein